MSVSTRDDVTVPRVDLVFDNECPHVHDARALLRTAIAGAGFPATWREWERGAAETPAELRGLGSPTILVDGVDVSGAEPVDRLFERANCCRVYENGGRLWGVPSLEAVAMALSRGRMTT